MNPTHPSSPSSPSSPALPRSQNRLSIQTQSVGNSRRPSTVRSADHATPTFRVAQSRDTAITEEIREIKRYEDFTTIDWVQDAVQEQARRRARRKYGDSFWDQEGTFGWRRKVSESYDAGQAWLVVTLVGAVIGLNAGFLNIVTEWLADVKLGYCTSAFYLNEAFCCWGAEGVLVDSFAPYAAGSGISEIKVIIAGFIMKGFLGFRTLVIKSLALPLSIGSGLAVGKEGPSVHFAVCTGSVISRWFGKYKRNASKTREILTATSAAGVAVAFGSPIGGVLFSLEMINPFRTGQIVMFQVKYDRTWHSFEIIFFVFLGVFGGLYGAFVTKWNLRAQAFRKKYLSRHPIIEATALAGATALICYPNMFLRINMTEMMEILFRECEGPHDYNGICQSKNRWSMVLSLIMATLLRIFFVIISYGCKVPAGIFVPSMAIGASFGRMVGILVQALHQSFPDSKFFAACEPDVPCITPGTYALLGAGAALSGIMHLTISVVVIMFELTGALTYILPSMIVVGITKAVGDLFSKAGIADRMIWFNGFPFLDNKEDHIFNVPVSHAMTSKPVALPATDFPVSEAEKLLKKYKFQGFPVVENLTSMILIGFIGRTELQYAISRAKREGLLSPQAKCRFVSNPGGIGSAFGSINPPSPSDSFGEQDFHDTSSRLDDITSTSSINSVDFSQYVDLAPITVHPRLALETVMEIFKKMGPRVILSEHRGRVTGLVTVKDCLKYQFKVERQEHADASATITGVVGANTGGISASEEGIVEQKAWEFIQWTTTKVKRFFRIQEEGTASHRYSRVGHEDSRRRQDSTEIVEGTEELNVELEEVHDDGRR
ncbi:glycerol ethanol, ferric requiring protein [Myotisia sp. PD_48]|nr:glycerol ethanol, ferric requiring protein [Myotisia sp. PD_48]